MSSNPAVEKIRPYSKLSKNEIKSVAVIEFAVLKWAAKIGDCGIGIHPF